MAKQLIKTTEILASRQKVANDFSLRPPAVECEECNDAHAESFGIFISNQKVPHLDVPKWVSHRMTPLLLSRSLLA